MSVARIAVLTIATASLAACAAGPRVSPVQVTRFHENTALAELGRGTIFVETAPTAAGAGFNDRGAEGEAELSALYKAAIAAELTTLGYREATRAAADQVAQVRVERYVDRPGDRRGPVSVGGGASTGTFGSGVGLGIGINLGGGQREMVGTDLAVSIRDKSSGDVLWEGRASISASDNSEYVEPRANAAAIADAMFREFPGNNGETIEVKVDE
ncbi:MAG: DUF4136 domain-containing protein [Pontixanthobacter sp.]